MNWPISRSAMFACLMVTGGMGGCAPDTPKPVAQAEALSNWLVDSVPLRVIGAGDGVEFGQISDIGLLANGSILVVDPATPVVWLFPAGEGAPLRVGHVGGGPGEYRYPKLLGVLGDDAFAIYDERQRRVSIYGADGSFQTSTLLRAANPDSLIVQPVGLLPGMEVLTTRSQFPRAGSPGQIIRLTADVVAADTRGAPEVNFGTFGYGEWASAVVNNTAMAGPQWYGWNLIVANSDRFVAIGEGHTYEIRIFTANGDSIGVIREARQAQPVSDAQRERILALATANNAPPSVTAPERFADSLPVFRKIFFDQGGLIWVLGTPPQTGAPDTTSVYTTAGDRLATVALPGGFRAGAASDSTVVGVMFDSDEVPSVTVLRLRRD